MHILIVDDEALARARLRTLLADCQAQQPQPRYTVAEAAHAAEALALLQSPSGRAVDAVLLDIHMPGQDGLALAHALRALPRPPAIVFVTAHADHAVSAFELDAVDYLTKPVKRERLHAALQRVAQRIAQRALAPAAPGAPAQRAVIVVSDRGRVVRVPVDEVLYLKAELKYVTLRTAVHTHVLDESLSELEARLGGRFLRVHRNALVARHAVRALERRAPMAERQPGDADDDAAEGWAVCIAPVDEWLAVSRRQVAAVREALVAAGG